MRKAIARFVYRHWQKFHAVRRMELAVLRRYLDLRPGQRVLDVGSGKGALCGALARSGYLPVGADPSLSALAIARRHVDPSGRFVAASGEELPYAPALFEKAVSVCVLEHTADDRRVLQEVLRVLTPGGVLALTVDCLDSPHVTEAHRRHHVAEYRCNRLYDDAAARRLLEETGFEVLETRYLFRGPLSIAILRWGSRYHYRGPFVLAFPLLYPVLLADSAADRGRRGGMILALKARKLAVAER